MPNFWSRGVQYFEEKLGADITTDKDFDISLKKIQSTEKGLSLLRLVLQNFNSYIDKFCNFFVDLNNAMNLIYENTPYYIFIEQFICKQEIINTHFNDLNKLVAKMYLRTSEWSRIFESAKNQLTERENKRKVYDHYEKKLLKIQKSTKDKKYIQRNEEKYSKAASEYVEISEKIYKLMQDSLKLSWKLINPIVSELIIGEQKLFDGISGCLSCFKDNIKRFNEIENHVNNPNSKIKIYNYDPMKYMKEKDLIKKISVRRSVNSAPIHNKEEEKKHRYTMFSWNSKNDIKLKGSEDNIEHLDKLFSQSRLTNAFGEISNKKLEELYDIEDDFI